MTLIAAAIALVVTIFCTSCKVQDCIPETIVRDSIVTEYKLDSIYLYEKDSIFIKEKADTVFVNKYVTRYKDVLKIERDTIWQENKVVEVKEVRYVPTHIKWFAWIGAGAILLAVLWVVLKVYRKFVLKV
jgi:hypothetical protein